MVKPQVTYAATAPARRLRAQAGVTRLVFMTDADRVPDPAAAMQRLPAGSIVILRDYEMPERRALAQRLRPLARRLGHWFLVAGDAALARAVKADGLHLPEHMLIRSRVDRRGFAFLTAACHSRAALWRAAEAGVDLALVSPVFATASHPEARHLGVHRLARMVEGLDIPIAALGGVNQRTAGSLKGLKLAAIAAISGLDSSPPV